MTASLAAGYTQCPGCLSVFRIDAGQLRSANGRVRCGLCGERFDARCSLAARLPAEVAAATAQRVRAPIPDVVMTSPRTRASEPMPPDTLRAYREQTDWGQTTALEMETPAVPAPRRWPWVLGGLVLALLVLAGQWLWFERDALMQDPALRPWFARLCAVAGCDLPAVRWPDQIAVVARALREHPERPGVLLFTATLRNRADTPQVWPQLGLTLLDVNGRVLARRWFGAHEYLTGDASTAEPMPPGRPVAVRLELRDPGSGAVGFEIAFR